MPPKSSEKLWEKALEARSRRDWDSVVNFLTEVISVDPNRAEAYRLRGYAYVQKGDHDRALADYDRAVELEPKKALGYSHRGGVHEKKGDYDHALADYDRAVELAPEDPSGYIVRGGVYETKGDHDHALADYDRAVELAPEAARGYIRRGFVYLKKGDHDRALADYDRAVELDPENALSYMVRGYVYEKKGDYDRAIKDHSKALKLAPKEIWFYISRGDVYVRKGDYDRALADYEKALEYDADGSALVRHFPFVIFFIQSSKGIAKEKRTEIFSLLDQLRNATLSLKQKAFKNPWDPREKFACAVHYTSATAAGSLVKEGGQFRLYNAANMNDPEEGWTMFDMLKGGDYRKAFYGDDDGGMEYGPVYIGSFFLDEGKEPGIDDTLLFWRLYGKEQEREAAGCSLSYSASLFAKKLSADTVFRARLPEAMDNQPSTDKTPFIPRPESLELFTVFYDIDLEEEMEKVRPQIGKIKAALDEILQFRKREEARKQPDAKCISLINACTRGLLDEVRFLFKSRHYAQEKEVRLIKVHYRTAQGDSPIKEDYEVGDVSPRLYVELPARFRPEKIVLGPRASVPDAQANYLKSHDEAITVARSKIRYR